MLRIWKYNSTTVIFVLILFAISQYLLNQNLGLHIATIDDLTAYTVKKGAVSMINSPIFWDSIIGTSIKLLLDIFVTAVFLLLADKLFNKELNWSSLLKSVSFAQLLFLLKYFFEFIYLKNNQHSIEKDLQQQFSIFSLEYFLNDINITIPYYLHYALQTISLFEMAFALCLTFLLSKISIKPFKYCFQIVLSGYIMPLLLWLLFISFTLFLNQ